MPRGVALNLLASALTILATVAFLAAATVVDGAPVPAPIASGNSVIVYRFYDAVNEVITTGDPAALEGVLAPGFAGRDSSATGSFDSPQLARLLVGIHAVAPDLRLNVADVTTAGNRAVALLAPRNVVAGALLGVPLGTVPEFWGNIDAFRIEDGRVAELWSGSGAQAPVLEPLGTALIDTLPVSDQDVDFLRLSAASANAWTLDTPGQARAVYVDAGALAVTVDPASQAPAGVFGRNRQERNVLPGETATVLSGQTLAVARDTEYTLEAAPSLPELRAFAVDFPPYAYVGPLRPVLESPSATGRALPQSGLQRELLAVAARVDLARPVAALAFGRVTLVPGTSLSLAQASGPVLVTVEAGMLDMDRDLTRTASLGGNGTSSGSRLAALERGETAAIPAGTASVLHVRGIEPAVAVIVTVLPGQIAAKALS